MRKSADSYHNLVPYKIISSSKFPIILAKSAPDATDYVIKVFIKESSSAYSSYYREKQILSYLKHPHIISYVPSHNFRVNNISDDTKFIIIEYAPFGDFFSFFINNNPKNEKLVRTYFHQLIDGIEHLHKQDIAHLDLKLENLLIGKDLLLKIADFDVAQCINDKNLVSQGSVNYRAPELIDGTCTNYEAADIFSAGVCLFIMVSRIFPFVEEGDEKQSRYQSYDQFLDNNDSFWKGIEFYLRKKNLFSESLRELLNGMWNEDPDQRLTIEEIKRSKWFSEPFYPAEEFSKIMQEMLTKTNI